MQTESGGYRRDHLRALTQRVEVARKNFASGGRKANCCAHSFPPQAQNGGFWLAQCFVLKWRGTVDEDGQYCFAVAL